MLCTWDSDNYDIIPFYFILYKNKDTIKSQKNATTAYLPYKAYTAYTAHTAHIAYIALTAIGRKKLFNLCLLGGGEILYV